MKNKTWGLVDSFFDKYDIVDHHIKSYNDFVEKLKLKNLSPKKQTVLKVWFILQKQDLEI